MTREQVMAAAPKGRGTVHIAAWGGDVGLRTLTLAEIFAWGAASDDRLRQQLLLVRLSVVGDDGEPLFTEADDDWLAQHPVPVMTVVRAAMTHNGLDAPVQDATLGN